MISLILVLVVIALVFCGVIIIPWYRNQHQLKLNHQRQAQLYQEKLVELNADLKAGVIEEQAYQAARDDLKLQLASELANKSSQKTGQIKRGYFVLFPLITLFVAFSIYVYQGKPAQMQQFFDAQAHTSELAQKLLTGDESFSSEELGQFYLGLRTKLANNPGDATGWLLLGRVAYSNGQLEDAMQSFEKSLQLTPNKYTTLMSYGQVLIATNDENYLKKAVGVYQQALQLAPKDAEALTMAGYVALQLDNPQSAKQYWRDALKFLPQTDSRREAITQAMPDLAADFDTESPSRKVTVNLSVSVTTQAKISDYKYLVVFARPQLSGPPAAVVRLEINQQLPNKIELTDANAMIPNFNLSSLTSAYITARLSKDADVMKAEGVIEINSNEIELTENNVVDLEL